MAVSHPAYGTLAARLAVSNLHKTTSASFAAVCSAMATHVHPTTGAPSPLLSADINAFVQANAAELDAAIDYTRDYEYVGVSGGLFMLSVMFASARPLVFSQV